MTVHIVHGIPGAGKTKKIIQMFINNPEQRKIYLAPSHERLNEIKHWLHSAGLEYTHWKGMKHLCPLKHHDPIKTMMEYKAPVRWMCKLCQSPELKLIDAEKCSYLRQFKNPKNIVLAPAIYLMLEQVKNYEPTIVAIDNVIAFIHRLPSLEKMNKWLKELNANHCTRGFISRYSNLEDVFKEQGHRLEAFVNEIERNLKEWIAKIQENAKNLEPPYEYSIEPTIKHPKEVIKRLLRIDPTNIIEWHNFVEKYGFRDSFARLHILEAFKLSLDREVYIINSLPNKWFVDAMILRFIKETGLTIVPKYEEIELPTIAKSTVYRVRSKARPNARYPSKGSVVYSKSTRNRFKNWIKWILRIKHPGKQSISMVCPKNTRAPAFLDNNSIRCFSLRLGDSRGSNYLDGYNPHFVISSYEVNPESIVEDFKVVFNVDPKIDFNKPKDNYSYKDEQGKRRFINKQLENYKSMFDEQEQYHGIHACHPALKEKTVYVLGDVPEKIREEFEVKDLFIEKIGKEVELLDEPRFVTLCEKMITKNGIYNADLVKIVSTELGWTKRWTATKINDFLEQNKDKYITTQKQIGNRPFKFIQER